jgi:hypothetical protein
MDSRLQIIYENSPILHPEGSMDIAMKKLIATTEKRGLNKMGLKNGTHSVFLPF